MEAAWWADSFETGRTVLVVDDDPRLLRVVSEMLKLAGYRTLEADSPEQALQVFEQNRETVDLLLSDVKMPAMTGHELSASIRAQKPDLVVVFMSADDGAKDVSLRKPFGMDELHARVAKALRDRSEDEARRQ